MTDNTHSPTTGTGAQAFGVAASAKRINVSERYLRSEIAKGRITVCKLGRRQVITPAAIDEYLAKHSIASKV